MRGVESLSEREKQTLRLLLRGYDAKSIARHLGLSVHTINERLRDARRKLGVSTSREAARLLAQADASGANFLGDKQIGVPPAADPLSSSEGVKGSNSAAGGVAWLAGGMLVMSLIIAAAALTSSFHGSRTAASPTPPTVVATNPKQGATIRPGTFLLSVTYDRPMRAGSYSFAGERQVAPEACATPELSKDGRTYSMRCTASAGRRYEVWFNRDPYMNFQSVDGVRAEPYRLRFSVAGK